MRTSILATIVVFIQTSACVKAQSWDVFIQSVVDQVSYTSIHTDLQTLESFGRKEIFDTALRYTGEWLIQAYEQMGYTDIVTDTFFFSGYECFNIIVTKQGTMFPDQYVIIDGHYDTRTGPGVNDNGSGVAIILEIARRMKDLPTLYSVRFINFSAEEYGLVGSSHYVQEVVIPSGMDIRVVFNIDEVGGVAGIPNDTIICERDESPPSYNNQVSWAFTDTLATITGLYSELATTISYAYGSDYVPFQTNGEIITGLYEYNNSPYPHTVHDSLANLDMDYVFEIAKASLASGMYFAGAYDSVSSNGESLDGFPFPLIFPNPFTDVIRIDLKKIISLTAIELYNQTGDVVLRCNLPAQGYISLETTALKPGFYYYRILNENDNTIYCGKLIKAP